MSALLKNWYLLALALVVSLISALGLIYLRKDNWLPSGKPVVKARPISEAGPTASDSFQEWEYSASELENLRSLLEAERAELKTREAELNRLRSQIQSETADLKQMRRELENLREAIQDDLIKIDADELTNLRNLSKLYSEMKAPAAVKVLSELDLDTVVKILSMMPADASAKILETMTEMPGGVSTEKAAEITEAIRKLKK